LSRALIVVTNIGVEFNVVLDLSFLKEKINILYLRRVILGHMAQ
jgi:hypothetical protein